MTGEIGAAGDIVTGGLIARSIEPRTGASEGHGGVCLNCGTALAGAYCHRCGQPEHIHRSLAAFWHDLAHGVLHFEGKVWRTLPLLAWRPGVLTRRYVEGERARFVSPLALFLFSVFLMFAVLSALGSGLDSAALDDRNLDAGASAEVSVRESRENLSRELARLDKQIAEAKAAGKNTGELRGERANVAGLLRFMEGGPSVLSGAETRGQLFGFKTGWARLDKGIAKANDNPNLLLYKLQTNAYKFSWALIPISVPFLWLIFAWRRQYRVYDHAIFVTYSLSFMTLLAVVLTVAGVAGVGSAPIAIAATFIPPIHIYRQLRGAYRLRRFNALLRTSVLLFFATFALTAFVLLLFTLGLLG